MEAGMETSTASAPTPVTSAGGADRASMETNPVSGIETMLAPNKQQVVGGGSAPSISGVLSTKVLIGTARESGVDAALELLARNEEIDSLDETTGSLPAVREEEEISERQTPVKDFEAEPESRMETVEQSVSEMSKKIEELTSRLEKKDEQLKLALVSIESLAMVVRVLVEEEEDEQKKQSLLEILITLMAKLMQVIVEEPEMERK